jgi:Beta-lactamase
MIPTCRVAGLSSLGQAHTRLRAESFGRVCRALQELRHSSIRPSVQVAAHERRQATGYGLGFEVRKSPLGAFVGHIGNVVGGAAFILIHPRTRVVVALTTNVGFVTSAAPPDLSGTPEPPQLAVPFSVHVLRRS